MSNENSFSLVKMKKILALFFLLFPFLCACQQKGVGFRSLPVEEFVDVIVDSDVQRLDVRTPAEYTEGHIPGSLNINVLDPQFAQMADSLLQKDKPVALYCRSGRRSKKAAELLSKAGYEVYELDSGFHGWQKAGLEVEK